MQELESNGSVYISIDDRGVAKILFGHPQSNSLPSKVLNTLAKTIEQAGNNNKVKVILLKSFGDRTFCAGASFDELLSINSEQDGEVFFSGFAKVINAIRKCNKFVVGRVQGKAVGGGLGLASAVDICYATQYASIKLSELALGIGPFVVGPAVERKMGKASATNMTINAHKWYNSTYAKNNNLFDEVFETTEKMDEHINQLLDKLSGYNPEAMKALKATFWKGCEDWDALLIDRAKISGKLVCSEFTKTFIQNFKA